MRKYIYMVLSVLVMAAFSASAQPDKRDVRRGNRDFKKENFKEAEIEYRKGALKDSLSVAANYNLAASLYRQGNYGESKTVLEKIKDVAPASDNAADYYYNLGDVAIANQDWQAAVDAFEQSLLRNPADLDAKENYIYARMKLQQEQEQQQNQQNNQNQQNDQNQQNNQNQQNDQNQQNEQNDQNNQNDQNQQNDQNDQKQQDDRKNDQQPKITPQAAQQLLQAIQAKEKETQDKVNKEKAAALQSRQKERNW